MNSSIITIQVKCPRVQFLITSLEQEACGPIQTNSLYIWPRCSYRSLRGCLPAAVRPNSITPSWDDLLVMDGNNDAARPLHLLLSIVRKASTKRQQIPATSASDKNNGHLDIPRQSLNFHLVVKVEASVSPNCCFSLLAVIGSNTRDPIESRLRRIPTPERKACGNISSILGFG